MNDFNIQNPAIALYFIKLNERDFEAVSQLFSIDGSLYPPFEREIYGRAAIAQYLQSEAKDVKTFPKTYATEPLGNDMTQYQVMGYVTTSFFKVNVGWSIQVNANQEIVWLKVKLLAELQDLLSLKRA